MSKYYSSQFKTWALMLCFSSKRWITECPLTVWLFSSEDKPFPRNGWDLSERLLGKEHGQVSWKHDTISETWLITATLQPWNIDFTLHFCSFQYPILFLRMIKSQPQEYSFIPKTWIFPAECTQFQNYVKELKRKRKQKTFIVKPANGAMGHG